MLSFAPFSLQDFKKILTVGALSCTFASGQTPGRFCLGGDLQHLSAAQRTLCSAKLAGVRAAAQRFGAPEDWHFVMVCGEEGWKAYAPFSTHPAADLERSSADTDLATRSTYFRDARLDGEPGGASERVVAREIASILLRTADPATIEARVNLWLGHPAPATVREVPVLTASR